MNTELLSELLRAHQEADEQRVHALLGQFLREHDPAELPEELSDAYFSRFDEMPMSEDAMGRMRARLKEKMAARQAEQDVPTLWECFEAGKDALSANKFAQLSEDTLDLMRRDERRLQAPIPDLMTLRRFLETGMVILPKESLKIVFEAIKLGYPRRTRSQLRLESFYNAARKQDSDL